MIDAKSLRAKTGLSVTDFCAWIGVPVRTWQHWEKGDRVCPAYVLALIDYRISHDTPPEKQPRA